MLDYFMTWLMFFSNVIYVDKAYVSFHDECWGVPVYDDK